MPMLSDHLALYMHPAALDAVRAAALRDGVSDSAWVRGEIERGHAGLLRGEQQPEPHGEHRGLTSTRKLLVIRCAPEDKARAKTLAEARGLSMSHMVRDMAYRAAQTTA